MQRKAAACGASIMGLPHGGPIMKTPQVCTTTPALHPPLRRFSGCHAEILGGLDHLSHLPALARAQQQARSTAEATLALFERQVVPHHLDEERELFVAVRRSAAAGAEQVRVEDLVTRLTWQHRDIERMWSALRPTVLAVAAGKAHAGPEFEGGVAALVRTYTAHTRLE